MAGVGVELDAQVGFKLGDVPAVVFVGVVVREVGRGYGADGFGVDADYLDITCYFGEPCRIWRSVHTLRLSSSSAVGGTTFIGWFAWFALNPGMFGKLWVAWRGVKLHKKVRDAPERRRLCSSSLSRSRVDDLISLVEKQSAAATLHSASLFFSIR